VSENDAAAMWEKLSRETRGLLEGLYAASTPASPRSSHRFGRP
jgi:hypothetical protein